MDAIYSATALRNHPREVKQAARERLVRITENGNGAYVFFSEEVFQREGRWTTPSDGRSTCSASLTLSTVVAQTLLLVGTWRVSKRRRRPSRVGGLPVAQLSFFGIVSQGAAC